MISGWDSQLRVWPVSFRHVFLQIADVLVHALLQLNEALGDVPFEAVQKDFSLRGEQDQMLRVAERVMGAMSK
jgi:hypothetical protein